MGDFYMWPMLNAIKHKNDDGSDPHILDMAPIYQEAYATLLKYKDSPRLIATGQVKLLPSYPHLCAAKPPTARVTAHVTAM